MVHCDTMCRCSFHPYTWGLWEICIGAAMHMAWPAHAVTMADFETSYSKAVTDFNIPSPTTFSERDITTFLQALEGN